MRAQVVVVVIAPVVLLVKDVVGIVKDVVDHVLLIVVLVEKDLLVQLAMDVQDVLVAVLHAPCCVGDLVEVYVQIVVLEVVLMDVCEDVLVALVDVIPIAVGNVVEDVVVVEVDALDVEVPAVLVQVVPDAQDVPAVVQDVLTHALLHVLPHVILHALDNFMDLHRQHNFYL